MDDTENFSYHINMIGFLLKKNFFDIWDNMFRMIPLNLGFLASLAIPFLLPGIIPIPILSMAVFAAGVLWCCVYLAAAALSVKAISDYASFGFSDFIQNIKAGWPAGIVMCLIGVLLFIMASVIIPFYLKMQSPVGLLLAAVIFWTLLISVLSFQFFYAVRARLAEKPLKIIKKCFIIFFDNPGFSVFTLLYAVITLLLSAVVGFLMPGPAGSLLFLDEALRLRLLKYDWLEENPPDATTPKRRRVPWDALLIEEREKTGTRTLRNFIFPWKD